MVPCAYAILYVLLTAPFSYLICEGKYSLVMNSILPMKGTVNPMLSPGGLIYFKPHLRGLGGGLKGDRGAYIRGGGYLI